MSCFGQLPNNASLLRYNLDDFPVYAAHERLSDHLASRMLVHWHTDFELVHVRSGCFIYTVDSCSFPMHAGDFLFINARQLHGIEACEGQDCAYSVVLIEPGILSASPTLQEKVIAPMLHSDAFPYVLLRGEEANSLSDITESIIRAFSAAQEITSPSRLPELLLSITASAHQALGLLYPYYLKVEGPSPAAGSRSLQSLRRMLSFIAEHYPEKLTLAQIAREGHMSPTGCNRLFRQYLQQTPVAYLLDYRLDAAASLLLNTEESIASIALSCGFSQQSYFSRMFVRRYSLSPAAYRKTRDAQGRRA
ncbi:MAG: helix-turn-helix domain-containing protein [Clostridia bacterium]|nr:helix-turn-helix domain-containing protein [Clostridia bacterium]MBR2287497.1 helix-turn-helix domain-containing protein [Clostridia bacterium]